jgi:hypothetical protein
MFAHLEGLVRLPSDNTARKSAPAPFHHTTDNLFIEMALVTSPITPGKDIISHHRLSEPEFLRQGISVNGRALFKRLIKVIANERAGCAGVGARTER